MTTQPQSSPTTRLVLQRKILASMEDMKSAKTGYFIRNVELESNCCILGIKNFRDTRQRTNSHIMFLFIWSDDALR